MSVTISDILTLDLLESAKVVAGNNGLENQIHRVNFSDCPIASDEIESLLVSKGDVFINSLYLVKDDEKQLLEIFKYFINIESSGAIIIDEYLQHLPKCVIELANEHSYPIIFIDKAVSYAELIKVIMELILSEQTDELSEIKIDQLLDSNIRSEDVIKIARHLNGQFSHYYQICFVRFSNNNTNIVRSMFNRLENVTLYRYHDYFLMIVNKKNDFPIEHSINEISRILSQHSIDYFIGISNVFEDISEFHTSIKQAYAALELESSCKHNMMFYSDLNVYKLLYPLRNTEYIKDFYDEVINPLQEYDEAKNADLFTTCKVFLENDADYKLTATELHQHENTIRYRISKARSILKLEHNNVKFIELLSIAIKIHYLINS